MSMKIGIRAWIDFAFRKIFGKPGNEICLISLLNAVLRFPHPVVSVEYLNPFGIKDFETDKLICVDVKATDQLGRVFIVEIQIVVQSSFAKRAVFYACEAYTDQLRVGQGYSDLKATYSICLLMRNLWDDDQLHHQFRLVDRESGRLLEESIEIHTVELAKYNGALSDVRSASVLEQWAYWIKNSSEHTVEELQELLPGLEFLRATGELNAIREITEEKQMYDAREKASLDIQSNLIDARQEGREEGREEGRQEGIEIGEQRGEQRGDQRGKLKASIQIYEGLLGDSVTSESILSSRSTEELESMVANLQKRLRDRSS
jgi:predicted transposase/invertase (TIGR01784 family)